MRTLFPEAQVSLFMATTMLWSCAAILLAAAASWFAYAAAQRNARDKTFEALQSIVVALEWELAFVRLWAQSKESPAYPQSKTELEYQNDDPSWMDPRGILRSFDHPGAENLTQSPYSRRLLTMSGDFSTLNYAILRFYSVYEEYRRYVSARSWLFDSVSAKSAQGTPGFTREENEFLRRVFEYNYKMHVELIGGDDSPEDQKCLHNVFRKASESLQSFKENLEREPRPKLFAVLHFVAATFVAAALVLMAQWARLRFSLPG
jgi:hypothetical protein